MESLDKRLKQNDARELLVLQKRMHQVIMKWIMKFILSFFKDNWNLNDYPVKIEQQNNPPER